MEFIIELDDGNKRKAAIPKTPNVVINSVVFLSKFKLIKTNNTINNITENSNK